MSRPGAASSRTKKPSRTPIAANVAEELEQVSGTTIVDDEEWVELEITGDLSGADLRNQPISRCRVVATSFRGGDLSHARITDCVFVDCDVSGVLLDAAAITRVEFRNCRMSGLVLNESTLRDVRITDSKADAISARSTTTDRFVIASTVLRTADFGGARLVRTQLLDCDLDEADFTKTSLDDVMLHGSSWNRLRGIEHMRGVSIAEDQVHDFAFGLLAAHHIDVCSRDGSHEDSDQDG